MSCENPVSGWKVYIKIKQQNNKAKHPLFLLSEFSLIPLFPAILGVLVLYESINKKNTEILVHIPFLIHIPFEIKYLNLNSAQGFVLVLEATMTSSISQ